MRKNYFRVTLIASVISVSIFAVNKIKKSNDKSFSILKTLKNKQLPPTATLSGTTQVCKDETPFPEITFTGSGGVAPYTFTYTINGGGDSTITTTGNSNAIKLPVNTNTSGPFVYNLITVIDSNGDSSTENETVTITVNEPPVVDFTFNNNGTCSGTPVTFTPNISGNGPFTHIWNFGNGSISTSNTPTHEFSALGCSSQNINVTLTITDNNGCSSVITKSISVLEKPNLSFNDLNAVFSEDFNNCNNNTTDPNYTINVGNTSASPCITTYDINWGDGNSLSNVTFPLNHTYTQLGSYNMEITGSGSSGCNNTVTYLIKNSSNPKGGIINPGNTVDLCIPVAPIAFTISSWGTNPPDTNYYVDFGDGTIDNYTQGQLEASAYYNASDPVNSQNFPIPHTYTESNCPNPNYTVFLSIITSCGQSDFTAGPIIILKQPDVDFDNPSSACLNTVVLFDNTSTNGYNQNCDTDAGYFWDFGDGTTSTLSAPSHTYTVAGDYTVSLYAENICGTTNTVTSTICIEPELVPIFTLNTYNGCAPLQIQTINTTDTSLSCGNDTFLWQVSYNSGFCGTTPEVWNFTNGTHKNTIAPSLNFVTAGTYTLSLTTTNTCGSNTTFQTIVVKRPPTATINPISDLCDTASIHPIATVKDCAPSSETITYNWSFPGGNPATATTLNPGTITYAASGNYQITFSITNSCGTTTDTENFSVNPIPNITNTNVLQTICSGNNTSEIILTSDLTNTTYNWTATAPSGITGFLASGNTNTIPIQTLINSNSTSGNVTYTVIPTFGGCDGNPTNIIITINPAPTFTNQPQNESICINGNLTPLSIAVNGSGTPSYQWYSNTTNTNSGGTILTGETNATFTPPNSPIGTIYYYCRVSFSSGIGCNEIISETARIEIVNSIQIDTQPIATQNICNGATISPLTITHSNGTGNITYQWYSNTTNSNTGGTSITGATTINYTPATFTTSGNYYYYVIVSTNGSGCNDVTSDVAEIAVINAPIISTQPITSQSLCQNTTPQTLDVSVSGGIGNIYNYQWYSNTTDNNSGGILISGATNDTFTPPTTNIGTTYYYCVITQSSLGCKVISNTAALIINAAPTFIAQPISETICLGKTLNTLSVTYTNGVGTPVHQWYSNTVNNTTTGTPIAGATNASYNPPSGTSGTIYYYNRITFSSGGCSNIVSQIAQITINQTPDISTINVTTCSEVTYLAIPDTTNGDIIPTGTLYTWSTPIIIPTGSITGASNETTPQSEISQTLTNTTTSPATVTYTVTPISGICTGANFTIIVTVNPSISITTNQTNSSCFLTNNGTLDISITGGIPFTTGSPYQIIWTGPNSYTNTNESLSNLEPGDYILTINDAGGCPFNKTFTILEPDELVFNSINFNPETISCFGANDGTIAIAISGGTLPYQFTWTKDGLAYSINEDLNNLGPGDYQISITDAHNCTPITHDFEIIEPLLLEVNLLNQLDIICYGDATGSINISISGGRPIEITPSIFDYNYSWTGPNGFTSNNQNLTNLIAGTYNVIVTDKSGCTENLEVLLTQPNEISIRYTTTPIICYGDNNASITIDNISGGTPPYTTQWSNLGSGIVQNNLSAGTYTLTIIDNTACEKEFDIIINEAPIFAISPIVNQVSCFGTNDASINLNLVGGIDPVTLFWNDNTTAGVERNNLVPGTYTVTITDGTPCTITETFTITEPDPLVVSTIITDALDCDDANSGAINLIVTGGTLPFTYNWSNGAVTEDLIQTPPGDYSVFIKDANGCEINQTWTINRFEPLHVSVEIITDFNCETHYVKQTFKAKPEGGVPPYQLTWSDGIVSGVNNEFMNTSQNGLIILDVTDSIGCTNSYSLHVDPPILGISNFTTNSFGYHTYGLYAILDPIQFTNTSTGDFISMSWNFGDGNFSNEENPTHTYSEIGSYVVTQTVNYPLGCIYTKIITLTIEKGYNLMFPNAFTPNNDTLNDYFAPQFTGLNNMTLNIYNTWGALIYSEKKDDLIGWNGKIKNLDAENGNYYFTFSAETFYGKTITDKGSIVLIK